VSNADELDAAELKAMTAVQLEEHAKKQVRDKIMG
jgi:hypothetical protein